MPRKTSSGINTNGEGIGQTDVEARSSAVNGYAMTLSGKLASAGPSVSMDSGSHGSPSRGSDAAMVTPGPNSTDTRLQHFEVVGDDHESPDIIGRRKKRGPRSTGGGEKGGRGLRHFSLKVCEKVESKGRTTYNEVADELVAEFTNPDIISVQPDQQQYDEKNIRRRVYDALNVLMAMDIIAKEKKDILWKGLPCTSTSDIEQLKAERMLIRGRLEKKAAYLQELREQIIGIQNLVQRNEGLFQGTGSIPVNGVALPFILVQTRPHATVEVEISEDMQLVHFDFNSMPFELHDDAYVLKAMNFCDRLQSNGPSLEGLRDTDVVKEDKPLQHAKPLQQGHVGSSSYQFSYMAAKTSASPPPLPGILKARGKHESHMQH